MIKMECDHCHSQTNCDIEENLPEGWIRVEKNEIYHFCSDSCFNSFDFHIKIKDDFESKVIEDMEKTLKKEINEIHDFLDKYSKDKNHPHYHPIPMPYYGDPCPYERYLGEKSWYVGKYLDA